MEPFHQCLAFGPVAIYLWLLGAIGLSRRPVVVSGGRDAAALALAVSGLIFVGPLALLFPESVAAHIGPAGTKYVWLILIVMSSGADLRAAHAAAAAGDLQHLGGPAPPDPGRTRPADRPGSPLGRRKPLPAGAGRAASSRRLGLDAERLAGFLRAEARLPRLVAAEAELTAALRGVETPRNVSGLVLLSAGNMLVIWLAWAIVQDPQAIARKVFEFFDKK